MAIFESRLGHCFFVTLHVQFNHSLLTFFVGRLGLVRLGFSIRVLRVSFYVHSMDSKSFWIAIDVFVYWMHCQ